MWGAGEPWLLVTGFASIWRGILGILRYFAKIDTDVVSVSRLVRLRK
jgi:hypothetical protein